MPSAIAREATESDARLLLAWRNDTRTRQASRSTGEIALADHLAWLRGVLTSHDRLLLVVEVAGEPVGTVRFDRAGDEAWEVSITLAPAARGRGLSGDVLAEGERVLTTTYQVREILAAVHQDNAASAALFQRAGYAGEGAAEGEFRQLRKTVH
ncbi:GNAT family N-acetyltransferase [Amycolatopsis sp. H20-H5]|uniref:GNAT family N-acetyltransferase n=1 Tax=Amycolatopsis sp. H20-H5 TaxID=3046309 RepID=UPI002DBA3768|nr:GNAT family N-acetyltransferase [Amycolatopsis sp. H20-H5]MEC3975696.1 GNAT family N-acetyltransferase [Amycolatopsis sp. H20-H5]